MRVAAQGHGEDYGILRAQTPLEFQGGFLVTRVRWPMRVSVLINNYNYAQYLPEAVNSVLKQSRAPDEVILVDDGSTDSSLAVLRESSDSGRLKIVEKENGGQLSTFNAGYNAATGDVLFFLDADDIFYPSYIEKALDFLAANPGCDFLMSGYRKFGAEDQLCQRHPIDRDLGYSIILALYGRRRIGGPTSTMCIRRRVLDLFMPLPLESDWRTRADDCLAFGASVAGAHKYYMAEPQVGYRIHGANVFQRSSDTSTGGSAEQIARRIKINRLLGHVAGRMEYFLPTLIQNTVKEYLSTPHGRHAKDHSHYLKAVWYSEASLAWKLMVMAMLSLIKGYGRVTGNKKKMP